MHILREIRLLLANYHVKSGIYHYYRGEYKQAEEFLVRALESRDPRPGSDAAIALQHLTHTHLSSGERCEADGHWKPAAEEFARAAALRPSFPDIQYRLGRARDRAGNVAEAINAFAAAIRMHP